MSDTRKALGKGLGSLIPLGGHKAGGTTGDSQRTQNELAVTDILVNPNQPRKLFPKEALDELAASIEEKGVLQPLIVRPIGGGKYELIAGERRFRASQQAGLTRVPVVIKDIDDSEVLQIALIENIQRQDLNPIEEALAFKELLTRHQLTQDELAKKVGKDRTSIANSLRLLKLPDRIRDYVINNKISMGHARALLAIENRELQLQIADDTIANNLSVREVELLTQKLKDFDPATEPSDVQAAATSSSSTQTTQQYNEYARALENSLRQKIQIKPKGQGGQILISFSNKEELENLVSRFARWGS